MVANGPGRGWIPVKSSFVGSFAAACSSPFCTELVHSKLL